MNIRRVTMFLALALALASGFSTTNAQQSSTQTRLGRPHQPDRRIRDHRVMVCHAAREGKGGVSRLILLPALKGHMKHNDCRLDASDPVGAACDPSDSDGDGFCGVECDPVTQVCPGSQKCGDGAGPRGADVQCSCGDTVVTNTTLDFAVDPVTNTVCTSDGLALAAGVQLNLNGNTIAGSDTGNGLSVASGGAIQNGTVRGFGVGIWIGTGAPGSTTVSSTVIESNAGAGVLVANENSASRAVLSQVTVQSNGGDGIHVRGAPGLANLDDGTQQLPIADYGFRVERSIIANNTANGIHLGDTTEVADVSAMVGGSESSNDIHGNGGVGILVEQESGLPPGADCGASAAQPGCTGATIAGNVIYDNMGAGVELRSGFIIPLYVAGAIEYGLGFVSNEVNGNGMAGPGCLAAQSVADITVTGPVGLSSAVCGSAETNPSACQALNTPVNQHCVYTGTSCVVAWDLRGDTSTMCNNNLLNAVFDYNTSDAGNFNSVGLRAINDSVVWADNNVWRSSDTTQNYSAAPGSFIKANLICSTRGTCMR
ncbi:MAG: right-handed parallel beta-helix repeat-containing protein [Cyanobacteria bacterium]|nr:right-handed parallel beta-helix repeat-containing protein [Cyanobacteriota bacterium]